MNIEDIKIKYHYFFTESTTFFCGQGWAGILDSLFGQITDHIAVTERKYNSDIRYNHMLEQCHQNQWTLFDQYYFNWDGVAKEKIKTIILASSPRVVKPICNTIVVDKIDEHAGSLTVLYTGGDDTVQGMILLATAMSKITCEKCGQPGQTRGQGWKFTSCEQHATEPNLKFFEEGQ